MFPLKRHRRKMKFGKSELLVVDYKAAFTVPYFAAGILFLTFGAAEIHT